MQQQNKKQAQRESTGTALLFFTSALDGVGDRRPRPGRFTPANKPDNHFTGGWVGHTDSLQGSGKSRTPPPNLGLDPWTVQARSGPDKQIYRFLTGRWKAHGQRLVTSPKAGQKPGQTNCNLLAM